MEARGGQPRGGARGRGGANAGAHFQVKRGGANDSNNVKQQLPSTYDRRPYIPKKVQGAEEKVEEAGDNKKNKGGFRSNGVDENTWYFKYFYADRPKQERFEVTADTEVPPIIPKESRKKLPDQKDFDKKMKDLDTKIENFRDKIVSIKYDDLNTCLMNE